MKKFLALLFTLVLTSMLISCGGDATQAKESENDKGKKGPDKQTPVEPAPDKNAFSFEAYDINGTLRSSDQWIGKQPTVVNIWGTWCPPCRREIPDLVKLYKEYRLKGVEILGLAVERSASPAQVASFAKSNSMEWVMLLGTMDHLQLYQASSVPTTIFYDRNGKEVTRLVGLHSYDDFKKFFEEISAS